MKAIPVATVACLAISLAVVNTVAQTTITVNELNDEFVVDGDCSLREAVVAANTDTAQDACPAGSDTIVTGPDKIVLPAGTIDITFPSLIFDDIAENGDLDILEDVTIEGQGAGVTILNGASAPNVSDGLLSIWASDVTVRDLTFQSIIPQPGYSGAVSVRSGGGLVIRACEFLDGSSGSSNGGALYVSGSASVYNSTFSGNSNTANGGAIYARGDYLGLFGSTFSGNTAREGGAIGHNGGDVVIENSTISGNQATRNGGAIMIVSASPVTIRYTTITENTADSDGDDDGDGGGLNSVLGWPPNISVAHSIIAGNTDASTGGSATIHPDGSGGLTTGSHNVIGDTTGAWGFVAPGDQIGTSASPLDAQLGLLMDNGGPTFTHAIAMTSPARDPGNVTCVALGDQRGLARTDGDCDSGAYEFGATLAAELVDFNATIAQTTVMLAWRTESESNNVGFDVEHARAPQEWESVGFVPGHGTSVIPATYTYQVASLEPGPHRFRLRQIDSDGTFTFTDALEVFVDVPDTYHVSAPYPNPFASTSNVDLVVARDQYIQATLHDVTGRQVGVLYDGFATSKQRRGIVVQASDLASGLYHIKIKGEYFATVVPVVHFAGR